MHPLCDTGKLRTGTGVPPINLSILLDRATKISVSVTDTFLFPYYIFSVACGKQPASELMRWIVSCSFTAGKHTAWLSKLLCLWAREVKLQVAEQQHGSLPCTQGRLCARLGRLVPTDEPSVITLHTYIHNITELNRQSQPNRGRVWSLCGTESVSLSNMTVPSAVQTEQCNDKETQENAFILICLVSSMNFTCKITT